MWHMALKNILDPQKSEITAENGKEKKKKKKKERCLLGSWCSGVLVCKSYGTW